MSGQVNVQLTGREINRQINQELLVSLKYPVSIRQSRPNPPIPPKTQN
jgi:hypothetical protein